MRCCICNKVFKEYGNNPWPVKTEGQCCDMCNMRIVIPERIRKLNAKTTPYDRTKAKVYASGNKWAIENFNDTHN